MHHAWRCRRNGGISGLWRVMGRGRLASSLPLSADIIVVVVMKWRRTDTTCTYTDTPGAHIYVTVAIITRIRAIKCQLEIHVSKYKSMAVIVALSSSCNTHTPIDQSSTRVIYSIDARNIPRRTSEQYHDNIQVLL